LINKVVGSFTGLAKSAIEVLVGHDDPDVFNIVFDIQPNLTEFTYGGVNMSNLRAGGTGLSLQEAVVRGIGELIERYSLIVYPSEIADEIIFASYEDLKKSGFYALKPEKIPLFSKEQYSQKDFPFKRFTSTSKVGWVKGYCLLTKSDIYVPAQMIYPGYVPKNKEPFIFPATTSGAATASSYEEAIIRGIYEEIERHLFMLTWFNRHTLPQLKIDESEKLNEIFTRISNKGYRYFLRHTTYCKKIHYVLGIAVNENNCWPKFLVGGAANLDPINAAYKALLETAQGIPFAKLLSIKFHQEKIDPYRIMDFERNVAFYSDPKNYRYVSFLLKSKKCSSINALVFDYKKSSKILKELVKILANEHAHLIVFDSTPTNIADIGFRVVKIFIPELVQLSLPSYPYLGHPKLREKTNLMPHPYP